MAVSEIGFAPRRTQRVLTAPNEHAADVAPHTHRNNRVSDGDDSGGPPVVTQHAIMLVKPGRNRAQEVQMLYQSPADFCAEYVKAHDRDKIDGSGEVSTLEVIVVSETLDTAQVEARWHTSGHAPDAGYYEVVEPTVFALVKRSDGWRVLSTEVLPYE